MNRQVRFRYAAVPLLAVLLLPFLLSAAGQPGFRTSQPAMLQATAPGSAVTPIISVGDVLPNGYRFEAIPDGIGVTPNGNGTLDILHGLEQFREHLGGVLTVTLPDGIGRKREVHEMYPDVIEEALVFLKERHARAGTGHETAG